VTPDTPEPRQNKSRAQPLATQRNALVARARVTSRYRVTDHRRWVSAVGVVDRGSSGTRSACKQVRRRPRFQRCRSFRETNRWGTVAIADADNWSDSLQNRSLQLRLGLSVAARTYRLPPPFVSISSRFAAARLLGCTAGFPAQGCNRCSTVHGTTVPSIGLMLPFDTANRDAASYYGCVTGSAVTRPQQPARRRRATARPVPCADRGARRPRAHPSTSRRAAPRRAADAL
jgi:hypothetical protein